MTADGLRRLLRSFRELTIAVVGDFFLDSYYDCRRDLEETSLETGKRCYQVVNTRRQPGAAGTVAANLAALEVGAVEAVGYCGDDGEGYELRRAIGKLGLRTDGFYTADDRFTPTYAKPCFVDSGRVLEELERIDIKNRRPTPRLLQERIIGFIRDNVSGWDGVIIVDQANEPNCGVVTTRVRRFLTRLARERGDTVFLADSRERIGLYRDVIVKPNEREAAAVLAETPLGKARIPLGESRKRAARLSLRTRRPVFLTLQERGMVVAAGDRVEHLPGFPPCGPIDPVGAGDSTSAAIVASLSAGTGLFDAGFVANLAGSVTVQQIGTTGTASPAQIVRRFREVGSGA